MNRALSLAWRQRPLLLLGVSVIVALFLQGQVNGANQAARDANEAAVAARAQTHTLKILAVANCESRNAARRENNQHVRVPMKAALAYLATLAIPGETNKKATAAQRAAAKAFVKRFEGYAKLIVPQPPLQCAPGG